MGCQAGIGERAVSDIADQRPGRRRRARQRVPGHGHGALARAQHRGEDPQERRLARAVRARDEHELAAVHAQVDAGEGGALAEAAHEAVSRRRPQAMASASTPARNTIAITPFMVRNAMSTRERSSALTMEFS